MRYDKDWVRLLEKTHEESNRLADERRHAAARQDAETIARLKSLLEESLMIFELTYGKEVASHSLMAQIRAALAPRHGAANETEPKSRIAESNHEKGGSSGA